MGILNAFALIIADYTVLAVIGVVALGFWLFGKRTSLLKGLTGRHPILSALVDLFAAPLLALLLGAIAQSVVSRYGFDDFSAQINTLTLLMLILAVAWCLARLAELFFVFKNRRDGTSRLPALQRGLLFGSFFFVGLASFIFGQGYSITGLYISTGAVAALVAFAMQQTLGDFFSGIALSIEHPFKLGERIRLADGSEGKIIDLNWRATRLLAWDNSTLVIPNSELAKQEITNFHGSDHAYAPWYEVKIPAEVDPRFAQALLLEAALKCSKVMKDPLPLVRLIDATTVPYTYMIWVHFPNYAAMFAGREQLFQEIHYALKDVGAQVSPDIHELRNRQVATMQVDPPTTMLVLKMLDITKQLSDEELEELAEHSNRKTIEAGTVIALEGETAKAIDVVIHGVVEASVTTKEGTPRVVGHLRSGEYFGLTSMFMETPSFLKFTASTNVTLIRIDIERLQKVLVDRPDLHDAFAAILKQRMDATQDVQLDRPLPSRRLTLKDILRRIEKWTL
ncbi:mechanosensitive ion channel family protein [Ascidiaceihabitans sp.]|uniref:mechanosensitive ion channel family protein n=1 Tax=Ascidiaceihabitans sp. TaxID=1872644 RepID=UPI0032985C70